MTCEEIKDAMRYDVQLALADFDAWLSRQVENRNRWARNMANCGAPCDIYLSQLVNFADSELERLTASVQEGVNRALASIAAIDCSLPVGDIMTLTLAAKANVIQSRAICYGMMNWNPVNTENKLYTTCRQYL